MHHKKAEYIAGSEPQNYLVWQAPAAPEFSAWRNNGDNHAQVALLQVSGESRLKLVALSAEARAGRRRSSIDLASTSLIDSAWPVRKAFPGAFKHPSTCAWLSGAR
jgi:hypothetical protein